MSLGACPARESRSSPRVFCNLLTPGIPLWYWTIHFGTIRQCSSRRPRKTCTGSPIWTGGILSGLVRPGCSGLFRVETLLSAPPAPLSRTDALQPEKMPPEMTLVDETAHDGNLCKAFHGLGHQ